MSKRVILPSVTALVLSGAVGTALASEGGAATPGAAAHQDPLSGRTVGTLARVGDASAFNPAISVILDGVFFNASDHRDGPAGFDGGHDHGHGHDHDGLENGFNLRETEVVFEAAVDAYFDAVAVLAVEGDSGVKIEEAYLTTRALPAGLQVRAGKFLSDIGYINNQHPHDWDFVDRPLMSEFLFGDHGLQEKGVQLSWVPATPFYSRLGLEVLQGESSGVASYQGSGRHEIVGYDGPTDGTPNRVRWRDDDGLEDVSGPRLVTAFLKLAPDLGYTHALQFGLSGGHARAWQRSEAHSSGRLETWDGDAWFAGIDLVYKYDAGRRFGHGDLTVQTEYFYREIDVEYASRNFDQGSLVLTDAGGNPDRFSGSARQDGLYLQAVYGIAPRWQLGARAEALGLSNDSLEVDRSTNSFESFGTSYRYSLQTTFRPTEFSALRAQVSLEDFADEDGGHDHHDEWTFMLQYNVSLGAHGAHSF